jgi:hypothetical protein
LRGLGGACVAAPFLSSVAERAVRAAGITPPRRLIVMYTQYGCITNRFFPAKSHGALTAADLQATSLKPLAPYVGKLLLPRGIRAMNEWTANLSRGQGTNDIHTQLSSSFFTCQPVSPNSDDPFSQATGTRFAPQPVGPSLDHVMAQQLSPNATPIYLRVAGSPDTSTSAISWSAAKTKHLGSNLTQFYSTLTGTMQGGSLSPDTYQTLRGKSIVDIVRHDLDSFARSDMSRADRRKLEAWKQLLDETGRGVAACSNDGATALAVTQANISAASTLPLGDATADALTHQVVDSLDAADLHSNLVVLAALCNLNPVIFMRYPGNFVFRGLGINADSHNLSHRIDNAGLTGNCQIGAIESLLKIDDYYARKFAHLVGLLNEIDEGDQKLLDHTATVWFQGQSDGLAHNLNNLPIVHAGSAGGYFKTGWAVNVDDGSPTLSGGNSELYCADGTATDKIDAISQMSGTDASLANAPINKYYCNLMNALGVKAGADGFPLVGGTEEVRCFGMYDKTEDFIHGGTNPPTIHNPGEFSALRA